MDLQVEKDEEKNFYLQLSVGEIPILFQIEQEISYCSTKEVTGKKKKHSTNLELQCVLINYIWKVTLPSISKKLTWLRREDMADQAGSTTSRKVRFMASNGITSYC